MSVLAQLGRLSVQSATYMNPDPPWVLNVLFDLILGRGHIRWHALCERRVISTTYCQWDVSKRCGDSLSMRNALRLIFLCLTCGYGKRRLRVLLRQ